MISTTFLDEILSILKHSPESYSQAHTALQHLSAPDDEAKLFLRLLEDCMREWVLPINHEDSPSFINIYKDNFKHKDEFEYLAQHTDHIYLKAVLSEMLWVVERKLSHAETAVNAYMQLYPYKKDDHHKGCEVLCSVCRICFKCRNITFDVESFWAMCAQYIDHYRDTEGYCALFVLEGLLACEIKSKEAEQILTDSIAHFEQSHKYDKAITYRNELIRICKKTGRKCTQLHVDNANDYEHQANMLDSSNPSNILRIVDLIHKAMAAWDISKAPDYKQNRERLARFLNPIKETIPKNMARIVSSPIDISNVVHSIQEQVDNSNFEEILLNVAFSLQLKGFDHFQTSEKSFLSSLFPKRVVNSKGRIVVDIPSGLSTQQEDKRKIAQNDACEYYRNAAQICTKNYLAISKRKFNFSEDTLRFLVDNNIFVPQNRRDTFLKGLVAGFQGEWSEAMHLLMPQVENAIRCLAEDCDIVTYKTQPTGIEECKSLTTILSSPELREYLEDDLIFNMEVFYTSEYGFGMRDQISHGLLSDSELNSYNSMAVWCFTLYLCCIFSPELLQRIENNRKDTDDTN